MLNIDEIWIFDGRNEVDIIYLDFGKAYDIVPHYCLQMKMKNLSISKRKSRYCKIFLIDRMMKVKIGNSYSETQNIPSSVPQESVLGLCCF